MNKARMTFRFDGQESPRRNQSEPLWNPVDGQPQESAQAGESEVAGAQDTQHVQDTPKPYLEVVKNPKRSQERKAEPKLISGQLKPKDNGQPRRYADMNAAISNWPEEDFGNPFQAHAGLGAYGYPDKQGNLSDSGALSGEEGSDHSPRFDKEQTYARAGDQSGQGPMWSEEPSSHRPPSRTSGWKIIGSVTGAIVTGALFGMVVLSLFNKEIDFPIPGLAAITESAQKAVDALPPVGELKQEEVSGAAVQVNLPAQDYYFLQYGVFSSPEGVVRAQQELKDAGYAAAQDTLDDKRVYAAISADREQAKLLSSEMKAEGVDLILHEASIPVAAAVHYSLETSSLELYAQQSAEMVKLLSETSASLLLEQAPDLSASLISELKDKHVQFTQSAAAVRNGFGGDNKQLIQNMETEMNSAVEALLQFDKTKAKSHLWEVQNSMMRYVLDEQRLFEQN